MLTEVRDREAISEAFHFRLDRLSQSRTDIRFDPSWARTSGLGCACSMGTSATSTTSCNVTVPQHPASGSLPGRLPHARYPDREVGQHPAMGRPT